MTRRGYAMERREFLQLSAAAAAVPTVAGFNAGSAAGARRPPAGDVEEATIADLQDRMTRGRLTSRDLVRKYLDRIDAIDRRGPRLNSVIEVNPDAVAIARELDRERRDGNVRGPSTASRSW
jgi:amidase